VNITQTVYHNYRIIVFITYLVPPPDGFRAPRVSTATSRKSTSAGPASFRGHFEPETQTTTHVRWSENGRRALFLSRLYTQPGFPLLLVTRPHSRAATGSTPLTTKLTSRRHGIRNHQKTTIYYTTGVPSVDGCVWGLERR